jgi:serine/threonine-protein kinase
LSAFHSGNLPPADLERIASHLADCRACTAILADLSEPEIVRRLGFVVQDSRLAEAEAALLEARARGIEMEGETARTVTHVSPATREAEEPRPLGAVGSYQLLERLGHGGMGIVYKARQDPLNRIVALKLLPTGADTDAVTRFMVEGEAVARLQHPGVVRIYELGENEGRLFYSMEYFPGGTLAQKLKAGPLPEREAAAMMADLARALHVVHQANVVHRDLKPSNLLLAADGSLRLADFGLAKLVDDPSAVHTNSYAVVGTASYMAPEQAAGQSRNVGPAADIYSVGAILYECLTGRPPFKEKVRLRLLDRVQHQEPTPPSAWRQGISRDLEAICLKCLEKDPARRYASAEALADDLQRWLRGDPPREAKPLGRWGRLRSAVRRRPGMAVLAGVAALLLAMGPLAVYFLHHDRPAWAIENRLERGETVTLIPHAGSPAWWDIIVGKEALVYTESDGAFTVHSNKEAYLELVREIPCDRYAFRAQVHHVSSRNGGLAGLYFLHGHGDTSQKKVHWMYILGFNDVVSEKENAENLQKANPASSIHIPQGNSLRMEPNLYGEDRAGGIVSCGFSRAPVKTFDLRSFRTGEGYRDLEVEVTPAKIRVFWEKEKVAEINAPQFAADAASVESTIKERFGGGGPNDPQVRFRPRLSLGLYVKAGSASFRDVVVTPLDASR